MASHYSTLLRLTAASSVKGFSRKVAVEETAGGRDGGDSSARSNQPALSRWLGIVKARALAVGFQLGADVAVSRSIVIVCTIVTFLQVG